MLKLKKFEALKALVKAHIEDYMFAKVSEVSSYPLQKEENGWVMFDIIHDKGLLIGRARLNEGSFEFEPIEEC